ncbi:MAG: hypothetical protein JST66_01325 [Bacteroidetes bacterium]|nr:hypothetical protein [Bacteroidota bacterium]
METQVQTKIRDDLHELTMQEIGRVVAVMQMVERAAYLPAPNLIADQAKVPPARLEPSSSVGNEIQPWVVAQTSLIPLRRHTKLQPVEHKPGVVAGLKS